MHTTLKSALVAAFLLGGAGAGSAQSVYGDTSLAYSDGVVYDDDLVPGRSVNQSFLVGEQSSGFTGGSSFTGSDARAVPAPSRNLIGSDGRAIDEIQISRRRALRRARSFRPNE